ncbi:response regulator [Flavobacterium orientale]|uniref:Response regulator n=1 Tax=Flavobacterium orientale TaxID=1756020 RepID=A0A916Y8Z4_9FLAO|nr:response regulator [Flavobacterium orientale]GGD34746.1 response regulator [Flavobacterium orientale]
MKTTKIILIIDDDDIHQYISKKTIAKLGADSPVFSCPNGEIGLEKLLQEYSKDEHFIIFLDINMPIMNGWEFIEKFLSLNLNANDNIDIYLVSSSTDSVDIKKADESGCIKEFLSKPIAIEKYKSILKE